MEDWVERRLGSVGGERTSLQQPRGSVGGLGIDEWRGSSSCCSRWPVSSLSPLLVPDAAAVMVWNLMLLWRSVLESRRLCW